MPSSARQMLLELYKQIVQTSRPHRKLKGNHVQLEVVSGHLDHLRVRHDLWQYEEVDNIERTKKESIQDRPTRRGYRSRRTDQTKSFDHDAKRCVNTLMMASDRW